MGKEKMGKCFFKMLLALVCFDDILLQCFPNYKYLPWDAHFFPSKTEFYVRHSTTSLPAKVEGEEVVVMEFKWGGRGVGCGGKVASAAATFLLDFCGGKGCITTFPTKSCFHSVKLFFRTSNYAFYWQKLDIKRRPQRLVLIQLFLLHAHTTCFPLICR